jgi:hypothetical protein
MHPDPGNHSAAGGHLKHYFKSEKLSNVEADVDLVIFAKKGPDIEDPAGQLAKLTRSSAAAAEAAASNHADASCLQELTRFPAHNTILNATAYFGSQQVRGMQAVLCSMSCTTCVDVALAA